MLDAAWHVGLFTVILICSLRGKLEAGAALFGRPKAGFFFLSHLSGHGCFLSFTVPPKDDKRKKDARKSVKKDRNPVNKSRANVNKTKQTKTQPKGKVQDKLNQVPELHMTNSVRKFLTMSLLFQLWSLND